MNTEKLLNKPLPKNYKSHLSNSGKDFIIDKYIGRTIWERTKNKKTRYILMAEALDFFQKEMIIKFGSYYKWQQDWARRNGFESYYDYQKFLAKSNGFETYSKYEESRVKIRGFENRSDYERSRIRKAGFKNIMEYLEHCAKKAGFKNYGERQKHWKDKRKVSKLNCL